MKRIFISHLNDDDEADRFLSRLCDSLRERHLEVMIDRERLVPGATWRREIYTWLSLCHAAIIVFSPRTIHEDSIWVPRETSLLMWRRALDPTLTIIPVLLPGVTLEDVEASRRFRDLQIRELQAVTVDPAMMSVETIATGLAKLDLGVPTPYDQLVDVITPLLGSVEVEHLAGAAALAGVQVMAFAELGDHRRRLAIAMLSSDLDGLRPIFDYLFARARMAARADLADILAVLGANWVDPEAAQWLAREGAERLGGRPARSLLLNASSLFAAEMYIQRASCRPPRTSWPLIPITGVSGTETSAEIIDEIEHALDAEFPLRPDPFQPDLPARRRRQLQKMQRIGIPLFFVMRLPPTVTELMPALEERYREANVLFLTGDDQPDPSIYPEDLFRMVAPPLADGAEEDARAILDSYMGVYRIPHRQ